MSTDERQSSFFDLYEDREDVSGRGVATLGKLLAILEEARLVALDYDRHKPRQSEYEQLVNRWKGIKTITNKGLKYDLVMARVTLKFLKDAPMRMQSLKRQADDMEMALRDQK